MPDLIKLPKTQRLSGHQPGRDIEIRYTGLRPGEKLYEDLFYPAEDLVDTPHPRIRIARQTVALDQDKFAAALRTLQAALQTQNREEVVAALQRAVPPWQRAGEVGVPGVVAREERGGVDTVYFQ